MVKLIKKTLLGLVLMLTFIGFSNDAKATHVMGADITYKCVDTLKFKITVKYYRWCNGVSFSNPSSQTRIKCSNGSQQSISLTLDGIREITPVCASAASRCNPTNTYGTGEGIEEHTYSTTIDFNVSPFSSLVSCCNIIIETGQCCRNGNINTGPTGNFYTYAEMNLCKAPCNSSPALTSEPIAILCCNQPFFFNMGAADTANFDSLSYAWANPLSGWSTNLSYSGTYYAYNHPFQAYYPGSLTPPYRNANASPPIGITLDPITGDIILTPTRCDEVTVAVVEVTEWRKDTAGTYQKIGVTRRDMQFIAQTCPDNNPPIINGPYAYNVCAGSTLCFNVTTNDQVFVPPPPASAPAPDTVRINWNRGIPGATFTVINPTQRLQTGQFCWTPGLNQASDLPYTFTVTARDNACPLNAVTVRSFRVTVKHRAQATRDVDTLPCGKYAFEATPIPNFKGAPSYRWQILDSNLNIIFDKKIASFRSTGTFLSLNRLDTIQFRRGGFYIIQHTVNNTPQNCPTTYYDTLVVPPLLEANLSVGPDTFICAGTNLRMEPYLSNGTQPFTFQWSTMGIDSAGTPLNNATANPGDTLPYFDLTVPSVQYDTAVALIVTDGIGCTSEDTIQVFLKANPKAVLPPDPRICTYDSVLIIPNLDTAYWVDPIDGDTLQQGDTLWKEWYFNGSSTAFSFEDSVTIHQRGEYVLNVYDSLGCADTDTLFLFVNDTVIADAGPDRTLCFNDTIFLDAVGLDTVGNGKSGLYRWYNITNPPRVLVGTATNYTFSAQDDVEYQLDLFVTEGGVQCYDADSVFIAVNQLPVISIGGDKDICCDYGNISLNFDINSPTGGYWDCATQPSWVSSNTFFTDSACGTVAQSVYVRYNYQDPATLCENSDSLEIVVNPLPTIRLREQDYCQDIIEVNLEDALVISPATFLGTPTWNCLECNGNDFSAMLEDRGVAGIPNYFLKVDEATYDIQNDDKDTVTLEFIYVNEKGCRNRDTVDVRIWRVPKIRFADHRDLCWTDGEVSLNELTDVNLLDGEWSIYDSTGFRFASTMGGLSGDTINTLNSVELPNPVPAVSRYIIRYTHTATGCPTFNDTTLLINPRPTITLTDFTQPPNFCEDNIDIPLEANPSGGVWTSTNPPALVAGNTFSPSSATVKGSAIWFYYNYTNPTTLCSNVDSIDATVDPLPSFTIPNDTFFCRPLGQMTTGIDYSITGENYGYLNWFSSGFYGNSSQFAVSSGLAPGTVTLDHSTDTDTFRVLVAAGGLGSCNDIDDYFDIIVHPRPDASITPTNPNGCNPVNTDFNVTFNNNIDPATTTYNWNLGGTNGTSTDANPSGVYDIDGTTPVSVVVTTDQGCDTTLNTEIDVYPLPTALFTPNPNNFTTAALPLFRFTNQSSVASTLGSFIETNSWDFGDPLVTDDTSTQVDPMFRYGPDTADYMVTLTVTTNYGCTDQFSYPVIVGPDLIVYIPNAFTPTNSGPTENEGFKALIKGEKYSEMLIFNRWGEIMFQTTDKNEKWDGTYKGEPAQQDVYAYLLKVTALDDEIYTYSGTITLIR